MKKNIKSVLSLLTGAFICASSFCPVSASESKNTENAGIESLSGLYRGYSEILPEYIENHKYYSGLPIEINPTEYTKIEGTADTQTVYDGRNSVLTWPAETQSAEWEFSVPESGLYNLELDYYTCNDSSADICFGILLDSVVLYDELTNVVLPRQYIDDGKPRVNTIGDEISPRLTELHQWQTLRISDFEGLHNEPLMLCIEAGKHVLAMSQMGSQPAAIGGIRLTAPEVYPDYAQRLEEYKAQNYPDASSGYTLQAENSAYKSSSILRMSSNSELSCSPNAIGKKVINVIGSNWAKGNQSITWTLEAPEDGLYNLSVYYYQNYYNGLPIYRQIAIDGKIPFKECLAYPFEANRKWQEHTLSSPEGTPYLFYLTKGSHILTMTVKVGELSSLIFKMTDDMEALSQLFLRITMLTGSDPDINYDYELDTNIPELMPTLNSLYERLTENIKYLDTLCPSKKPMIYNQMKSMQSQYKALMRDSFSIASRLDEFTTMLTQYSSWVSALKSGQLMLDEICLLPPTQSPKSRSVSIFKKIHAGAVSFASSFVKDYSNISGVQSDGEDFSSIDVWVGMGQAWGVELKDIIETRFTPKFGTEVNMRVIPGGQLGTGGINAMLLSIVSGNGPDAALGIDGPSVGEYAMRNALAEISAFDDFHTEKEKYFDSAFAPLTYKEKVYGIPQSVGFLLTVYRKDIFNQFDLSIPQTWDDMYKKVIPVLAENNMQISSSPGLIPLLHQNGGQLYSDDLSYTGLDSREAYKAFKQHCELYSMYGVPVSADFFNRFRSGEMPIGFCNLDLYMQLITAAPELAGNIGVALLPGVADNSGAVNHDMGGILSSASIILEQSGNKEIAWEFIKWWMSDEIQEDYGFRIEALMGEAARVASANEKAFNTMNWSREHLSVIKQAYKFTTDYNAVLGSYFTGRHIDYAFNRVIISKTQNERDSLEKAVRDINKELARRRAE